MIGYIIWVTRQEGYLLIIYERHKRRPTDKKSIRDCKNSGPRRPLYGDLSAACYFYSRSVERILEYIKDNKEENYPEMRVSREPSSSLPPLPPPPFPRLLIHPCPITTSASGVPTSPLLSKVMSRARGSWCTGLWLVRLALPREIPWRLTDTTSSCLRRRHLQTHNDAWFPLSTPRRAVLKGVIALYMNSANLQHTEREACANSMSLYKDNHGLIRDSYTTTRLHRAYNKINWYSLHTTHRLGQRIKTK